MEFDMSLYRPPRSKFYWYSLVIDGKRVRKSTKQTTKYLATQIENDALTEARAKGVDALNRKAPTLAEFSTEFLKFIEEDQGIEPETRRFYRHGWTLLAKTKLASMKMDAITELDCRTAEFPGGNYTANQGLRTLRRMFSVAKMAKRFWGELPKIETRKVWGRKTAMTLEQAQAIGKQLREGSDPKDVLLVMRGTGMRPREIYRARWEHVKLGEGIYQNPDGKTATVQRAVPLLDTAGEIFRRRWLEQGQSKSGWVFPSDSKSGHIVSIAKAFRIAQIAAKIPANVCLYTARHGVGTELGAILSLKEVKTILGHSDSRTALGYQHPSTVNVQARLDEARAKACQLLSHTEPEAAFESVPRTMLN
jgi:integrase